MDPFGAQDEAAVRAVLLERYLEDRLSRRARTPAEYEALFPEHRELVRAELAALEGAGVETAAPPERPLARLGPYELVRELGRGGQGVVYLAEDSRLRRRVALKVLPSLGSRASELARRFQREADLASRLDHPGICPIFEAGAAEGALFIAMRYVEGETLAARIGAANSRGTGSAAPSAEVTPSSSRRALLATLELFEKCAAALHCAHEAGVIHRDVKPANIMIDRRGDPVILDFGLARDEDEVGTLTRTGDLFGTPAYMAPEQLTAARSALDRRTDVYSLGVSLYEAVTGRRPFEAPTREGLFQAILASEPPDPHRFNASVPADLRVVLETALAKEMDRRYQSALEFAEDLRRVRSSEPIRARAVPWSGRVLRWARRSPARAALAMVLALGLPALTGLSGYLLASREEMETGRHVLTRSRVERALDRGFTLLAWNHSGADAAFREALELDPASIEATVGLVLHHTQLLRVLQPGSPRAPDAPQHGEAIRRAIAFLDQTTSVVGRHPDLTLARVHCLERLGDEAGARELRSELGSHRSALGALIEASRIWPLFLDFPPHKRAAHEIHRLASLACDLAPRPQIFYYVMRGVGAREIGKRDETLHLAELILERWPEDLDARLHTACMTSTWEGSAELLEEVLRHEPDNVLALTFLGISSYHSDKEHAALCFRRALAIGGPDHYIHCRLGNTFLTGGRPSEGFAVFDESVALWPHEPTAWVGRGLARSALHDLEGAEADFRRALDMREGYMGAHWFLGRLLAESGRFEEAIALLRRAVEIDDLEWRLWRLFANTLELAGRDAEARDAWEQATRSLPDDRRVWNGFAWFLVDPCGAPERWAPEVAVDAAQRAVSLSGGDVPYILNTLGVALYRRGEYERALEALERAVALDAALDRPPSADDLAFLAAASARLGCRAEAADLLVRARERLAAEREEHAAAAAAVDSRLPWDVPLRMGPPDRTERAAVAEAEAALAVAVALERLGPPH